MILKKLYMEIVMTSIAQSYFLFIIWLISLYILLSATQYQPMLKRTQVSKIAEVLQVLWNLSRRRGIQTNDYAGKKRKYFFFFFSQYQAFIYH